MNNILEFPFTVNGSKVNEPYGLLYRLRIKKALQELKRSILNEFGEEEAPKLIYIHYDGKAVTVLYCQNGPVLDEYEEDETPAGETLTFYEMPFIPGGSMRGYYSDYGFGENDREYTSGYLSDYFADGGAPFNDRFMKVFYHSFVKRYLPDVEEISFSRLFED